MNELSITVILLAAFMVVSAIAVVVSKEAHRRLFIQTQKAMQLTHQLEEQQTRLLLEQTTLATQSRIERIAKANLSMHIPQANEIIMVK